VHDLEWEFVNFSVHPLCSPCLCGELGPTKIHHSGTEGTEHAQRLDPIRRARNTSHAKRVGAPVLDGLLDVLRRGEFA
jgi:hypothetical protein